MKGAHGVSSNNTKTAGADVSGWLGPYDCIDGYCVYANMGYARGRGLVAITTEANFPLLKTLEYSGDKINGSRPVTNTSTVYNVQNITGKGLGMVANKELHRGDAVLLEVPILLVHEKVMTKVESSKQHRLLDTAVDLLPSDTKTLLLSQMGHSEGHRVKNILFTNTFQIDIGGEDGYHYGNYPSSSRFNHDCRPNVAYYIDENLLHHTTIVRTVHPGEELTISYLDPIQPLLKRQKLTRQAWGFNCTCTQCSLPSHLALESDMRISLIHSLERILKRTSAQVTMTMIRNLVDLYRRERLEHMVADGLTLAAMNANMLGVEQEAREFARLAVEAGVIEGGESRDVRQMREMVEDPRGHFSWRLRVREQQEKPSGPNA